MTGRIVRRERLTGVVAVLLLLPLGGCSPGRPAANRTQLIRPLATHPVDRLLAAPAPLDAPESYLWSDRQRFQFDLQHHIADLHRQAGVLRTGLSTAAGPAPQESLRAIRQAETHLLVELSRLSAATPQSWDRVRLDVLEAVVDLGRAIERARLAASPSRAAAITM
ncbi:MAG TPA: hypothetical protein VFM14_05460 [Gemmatimonadales bacterium]|nr:hypothetical protein [Gemmatimonadales bacterium]